MKAIDCLIALALCCSLSGEAWADAATGRSAPAVPVSVAAAARADVPVLLGGIGTVQAFNTVTIRTQVDGQLAQVLFTEGQKVSAGDVLAIIDPRLFQAAYDEATAKTRQDRAALADAQAILAREADLAAKSYTPTQTVDTQRATVDELTAQIAADEAAERLAATNLSYTKIVSPIDGVTGIRLVDVGNILHPSDPAGIVVVTQLQPISVVSTLPEQQVSAVRNALAAGPVAAVARDRAGGRQLGTGTVAVVDNEIDPASGTIRLKSTFANADGALWPGLFVYVAVQTGVLRGVVTVPPAAVQRGPDGFFVYVVTDGVARVRAVQPGQTNEDSAVIERGLSPGELVVTDGQYRLADGTPVGATTGSPQPAGN